MYEKSLIKSGLTSKQAKIYLACLELGAAKAPEIARKSEIKRTTAYGILDELVSMGLISISPKGRQKLFKAQDPKIILNILDSRKREISSIMPNLQDMLASFTIKPKIEFFEGRHGIKNIYEDTLKCRVKKVQQIVKVKDFIEFPGGGFAKDYVKRRAAKNIVCYALHPSFGDIHDDTYGQESVKWKRHVRYLPAHVFSASMIMIYDHKVAMISTKKENFGFIIESKEFSNTLRAFFEFMWGLGSKEVGE